MTHTSEVLNENKICVFNVSCLLATVTFFAFDVIADSESASDESIALLVGILLPLGIGNNMFSDDTIEKGPSLSQNSS